MGKSPDHAGTFFTEERKTKAGKTLTYFGWRISVGGKLIVRKAKTSAERKKAVQKVLNDLEAKGFLVDNKDDMTVKQKLLQWLEVKVAPNKARKTHSSYSQICNSYLIPCIGKQRVSKLTSLDLQRVVAFVQGKGLSPRTAQYSVVVLCLAIGKRKAAMLKDEVAIPTGSKPRDQVLELEDINEILDEAGRIEELKTRPGEFRHVYRDRHLVGFLLNTGLRISEALGLQIVRVNLKKAEAEIDHQLERFKDSEDKLKWELSPPKTAASARLIPLSPESVKLIRSQLSIVEEDKRLAGKGYTDNGLLFATESGMPIHARNVRRSLDRMIDAVNKRRRLSEEPEIERTSLHDLRRTYLTHLADAESRMHVVSAIAGHTNISTTQKFYVRARELGKREAALKISFGTPTKAEKPTEADGS